MELYSILQALNLIENGQVKTVTQKGKPTPAPKIFPEHCHIQWNQVPDQIVNLIRGLSPFPGAFTLLEDKRIKIYKAKAIDYNSQNDGLPGEILDIQRDVIVVAAKKGKVQILELQIEGKKRMKVDAFMRGYHLSAGTIFT